MAVVGAGPVLAGLFDVYLSAPIQLPAQWCEDSRYKRVNNRVPGGGIRAALRYASFSVPCNPVVEGGPTRSWGSE